MRADIRQNVRHNFAVNVLDGGFYGFALSFASFVTVLPLFISTLTDSTLLVGLIASIHSIGWFFPQLLTARHVGRMKRYRPMVVFLTLQERLPYFPLAIVAWLAVGSLDKSVALFLTFFIVIWQSLGAGLTATPWQSMIAKVMPENWRGTFYGMQSALANLCGMGGAIAAGLILKELPSPLDFTLCFLLCGIFMMVSLPFLAWTREPAVEAPPENMLSWREFAAKLIAIIRANRNYRWFVAARMLAQLAVVGSAFYTIYAVRHFGMDEGTAGIMTGVLMLAQTLSNPLIGWLGDRLSHRTMYAVGVLMAGGSGIVALIAPSLSWFYVVFALIGAANAALWTTPMAFIVEFGAENERPYYIGLTNTLVAPASLIIPLVGGWLADAVGFNATFVLAGVGGIAAALMLQFIVREPRRRAIAPQPTFAAQSMD